MWRVPKSPCPQVSTSQCKERRRRTFGTGRVKKNMEDVQRNPKKRMKVMRERGGKTLGTCR